VKNSNRHKHLILIVAGLATVLSGCQNRKNGMFGSDNWGRNGYANAFLNRGVNPYLYANSGGQVVGYLVYNQSAGLGMGQQQAGANLNPAAGGVQGGGQTQTTGGNSAGGIQGGSTIASNGTPCLLKVAAISPDNYSVSSNQNFGSVYHETGMPSSGRGVYQTGVKFPITCGKDSEIAGTQNGFYASGGSTDDNFWAYRTDTNGAPRGAPSAFKIGPTTKVTASPSGHIAVITNGGRELTLFRENRIGGDGGWVADKYHSIPAQNGALYTDVVIDDKQGAVYAGMKYASGAGMVQIYRLNDVFEGQFNPRFNSAYIDQYMQPNSIFNFQNNFPNEATVSHLFRSANPIKLKNNNGLTGIFTNAGRPFFMETGIGLSPEETVNKTPEELDEIYKNNESLTVQDIRVFDPFQTSYHTNSTYVQPNFQFKDFAVGNNTAYLMNEQGTIYTVFVGSDYQHDASTPWENRLNMGMKLNTIEMSYDLKYAIIAGSNGISVGRVSGNNLIFASTGRPDISENAEVIHAAGLAKINRIPLVNQPAAADLSASANKEEKKQ
jgi:hypothetical protein